MKTVLIHHHPSSNETKRKRGQQHQTIYVAKQQPAKGGISHLIKHDMCEQKICNLKGRSRVKTHIHTHTDTRGRAQAKQASKPPQPKRTLHAKQCQPASIVSRQASKQASNNKKRSATAVLPSFHADKYIQPNKKYEAKQGNRSNQSSKGSQDTHKPPYRLSQKQLAISPLPPTTSFAAKQPSPVCLYSLFFILILTPPQR